MTRLLLGNLDCEAELARGSLPRSVLAAISGAATLLRVFAHDDDLLWTPVPVAPERMIAVAGLARPRLVSGAMAELPAGRVLAWGETPAVAAVRRRCGLAEGGALAQDGALGWRLWRLAAPAPAVVARVLHRGFCLELARELGCALPGARRVGSLAELAAHLRAGGADGGHGGRWVVKAPLSAAGRDRFVAPAGGGGLRPLDDPAVQRRLARWFARGGELLFEPWLDRVADFGAAGLVEDGAVHWLGGHRLQVDAAGHFLGIDLESGGDGLGELAAPWRAHLRATVEQAGRVLERQGYRGPFGLDACVHRQRGGELAFHPLIELNARMTFGLVARGLAERLGTPLRLRFGRLPVGVAVLPLLAPAAGGSGAAWLELDPPAA